MPNPHPAVVRPAGDEVEDLGAVFIDDEDFDGERRYFVIRAVHNRPPNPEQ